MDNSKQNTINGEVQEEINRQIESALNRVANPADIPGLSKTHQEYFTKMWFEPNAKKRIALVKEMKSKLREDAGDRIREKL